MGIDGDAELVCRTSSSRMARAVCVLGAMLLTVASPGCSFIITRGPEPTPSAQRAPELSRTPSPECTSSVAAPLVDTVLATASAAVLVAGVVGATSSEPPCQPGEWFCGIGRGAGQAAGWGAIVVGAITGAVFTASAVTGYGRTADCRRAETALPTGHRPMGRHLLDVEGIAEARAREEARTP